MAAPTTTYVELQVTSHFSFLRGASSPDELFAAAALQGHTALGIVDRGSVAGLVRGWEAQKAIRTSTVLDVSLSFSVAPRATLTLRGRNLTDAFYGEYSGYPTTNVYIGAPRSFEVALATRF